MEIKGKIINLTTSYAAQDVSGGERLIPLYCAINKLGQIKQQRIIGKGFNVSQIFAKGKAGDLVDAKETALKVLIVNPDGNVAGVLIYDEELEIDGTQICAFHCICNKYADNNSSEHIVTPYSKLGLTDGFKVYMPNPIKINSTINFL